MSSKSRAKVGGAAVAACLAAAGAGTAGADTIAITEFMVNPWGTDVRTVTDEGEVVNGYEWTELFNYGAAPVNLEGWTLKDNASTVFTFPDVTVPSGGYVIASAAKFLFEERWLSGASDSRVIDGVPFQMNNGSDGLYLRDAGGDLIWSVGYSTIGDYRGTWLTGNDFSATYYGEPPQAYTFGAYINRNGNDGSAMDGVDLGLGYEGNEFTADPFAYASAARSSSDNPDTPEDETLIEREFGSPLLGQYQAVPEPASLALLAVGAGLMVARRR